MLRHNRLHNVKSYILRAKLRSFYGETNSAQTNRPSDQHYLMKRGLQINLEDIM